MAKSGDVILNPIYGERVVFRKTAKETNGELLEFEDFAEPLAVGAPEHVHPKAEERFRVVSGTGQATVGKSEHTLNAGDELVIPAGTPHRIWNPTDADVHAVLQNRPALRLETFLETAFGLVRDGKTNDKGFPNMLQGAVIAREYFDDVQATRPPVAVQKVLFAILAPIGKLLGYRARYPQYSGEE